MLDLLVLAALVVAAAYGTSLLPGNEVSGSVKVVDGDSLILDETEVRLLGIDAPEGRQTCTARNGNRYRCGREAAKALRRLVSGRRVACSVVETDRYGRAVSRCKAGDVDLNLEMVRRGWAVVYLSHSREFAAAESRARKARRGLWQGLFDRPHNWRRLNPAQAAASGD